MPTFLKMAVIPNTQYAPWHVQDRPVTLFGCFVRLLNPCSHEKWERDKVCPGGGCSGQSCQSTFWNVQGRGKGTDEAQKSSQPGSVGPSARLEHFIGVKSLSQQAKHTEFHLPSFLPECTEVTHKEGLGPPRTLRGCTLLLLCFSLFHRSFRGPLRIKHSCQEAYVSN